MPSNLNPHVEVLKSRLASGEITLTQFHELLSILQNDANVALPTRPAIDPGRLITSIDDIQLFEKYLKVGNDYIELHEITKIDAGQSNYSVNFLPISKNTSCSISFKNREPLYLGEDRTYFGGSRHKDILAFTSMLRAATYPNRLRARFDSLMVNKTTVIGTSGNEFVFLNFDGTISLNDKRVRLKIAREKGIYEIGRAGIYIGLTTSYNPYEALVCEESGHLNLIPKSAIRFEMSSSDFDIINAIVEVFSGGQNPFSQST